MWKIQIHQITHIFQEILNARVSRRSVVRGGIGMTAAMMLGERV